MGIKLCDKYVTPNLYLACYLKAKGIKFLKTEATIIDSTKCNFVFENDIKLNELLENWRSEKTDESKRLLQSMSLMKKELHMFFNDLK